LLYAGTKEKDKSQIAEGEEINGSFCDSDSREGNFVSRKVGEGKEVVAKCGVA
jgi:hypothetical protein